MQMHAETHTYISAWTSGYWLPITSWCCMWYDTWEWATDGQYLIHYESCCCNLFCINGEYIVGPQDYGSIYPSPSHTWTCKSTHTYTHTHLLREQTDRVVKNSWQGFDEAPLPSGRYGGGRGGLCEERYLITLLFFCSLSLCILSYLLLFVKHVHTARLSGYPKKAKPQSNAL